MITNLPPDTLAVREAIANGFDCANCGRRRNHFVPIRSNTSGPFFCSFFCGFRFRGNNGDERAATAADNIARIFGMEGN